MALDTILLTNFRNHHRTVFEGAAQFNLLIGENGAGKTNVLEAVSLLAPGRGLRRAALASLPLAQASAGFAIHAKLRTQGGAVELGTAIMPDRPGRRIVHVNGAPASATRLAEWLGIGWLTPAMDRLFSDGAAPRRRFLDRLVLATDPAHAGHAARLDQALAERNRMLADAAAPDPAWITAIEDQIAESGSAVAAARGRLVTALDAALRTMPDSPFPVPALFYAAGGPDDRAELAAALAAGRARDRAAQRTLTGPHRDDLAVSLAAKGQPAAECSTGEQKAMLIAIVLAHAELQHDDRPRLLLLDEVAAHLDPLRRAALFDRLRKGRAQVWLTGTECAPFDAIAGEAAIWRVSGGQAERIS